MEGGGLEVSGRGGGGVGRGGGETPRGEEVGERVVGKMEGRTVERSVGTVGRDLGLVGACCTGPGSGRR